jgi:hypothetical protein
MSSKTIMQHTNKSSQSETIFNYKLTMYVEESKFCNIILSDNLVIPVANPKKDFPMSVHENPLDNSHIGKSG